MVGLYFVTSEYGPTAGVVCGKCGADVMSLKVLSDEEPWQLFVTIPVLLGWELFSSETDAAEALRRTVEQCSETTSKTP